MIAIASVLAAGLVKDTATMIMLHPHQYVYYNLLAGGVRGADGMYEMDYWSNFMREAVDRLTEYVAIENGGRLPDRTFLVDLCTSPWPLKAYAPAQFEITEVCRRRGFFHLDDQHQLPQRLRWQNHHRGQAPRSSAGRRQGSREPRCFALGHQHSAWRQVTGASFYFGREHAPRRKDYCSGVPARASGRAIARVVHASTR